MTAYLERHEVFCTCGCAHWYVHPETKTRHCSDCGKEMKTDG